MKWDKHIQSIINRTKYLLFVFSKIAYIMKMDILLMIYYALFHSIATYGIVAWGGAYRNSLNELQMLQTRLIKSISKNQFLIKNYPLNLQQSFTYESTLYHYSNLSYLHQNRNSKTRNKSIPYPKMTKTISKKNSYIEAITTFNEFPNELKGLKGSIKSIKSKLKKWIKNN